MYDKCYFCLDQLPKLKKESTASFFVNFGGAGVQKSQPTLLYITFESPRWAHTTIISGYLVNRVSQIWRKRIIIYSWSLSLCLSFITFRCWIFLKFFFGVLVASKKPLNDDINVWEVGTYSPDIYFLIIMFFKPNMWKNDYILTEVNEFQ